MAEKTIAQQLADAQATISTLTQDKATLQGKVDKAETDKTAAVTAAVTPITAERDQARADLKTEQAAHTTTKGQLSTAQGRVTTLEAEAKTAEERAVEIAASQSTPPVKGEKKGAGVDPTAGGDLVAQYNAIESPRERAEFRRKNYAKLMAASQKQNKK